MNPNAQNSARNSMDGRGLVETPGTVDRASTGEDTLRLIAGLPAPGGLEERVQGALRAASRRGRVLAWPAALRADAAWMRAAAAAAIVFVVAGGGWGIYSRIQPFQQEKVPATPARVASPGGFSGAGAVSTPKTLDKPVVSAPAKPAANTARKKTNKQAAAPGAQATSTVHAAPSAK